jgi:hypothetical protein
MIFNAYITKVANEEHLSQLRGEAVAYRLSRAILARERKHQDRRGRGQPSRIAWVPRQQPRQPQLEESGLGKHDSGAADLSQRSAA